MANNRMYLICNVCHPERPAEFIIGSGDKGSLCIAKWYPVGAYYSNPPVEEVGRDIFQFFEDHQHLEVPSEHYTAGAGQENPVRIEYESEGLPVLSSDIHLSTKPQDTTADVSS